MIRTIILALLFACLPMAALAQSDINPEIANCQEIRDPDTLFQVEICSAHAGCKLTMAIQKVCTKVKTFLGNLKNIFDRKGKLDSMDAFDASAPDVAGDTTLSGISAKIRAGYNTQATKELLTGQFESGVKWVYEGGTKQGKRDGTGVLITESGNILRGDFVEGKQAGLGEVVTESRRSAGSMIGGKVDGIGVERKPSGDHYEGDFKNGLYEGKGVRTNSSGFRYEGDFKNSAADGWGSITTADGQKYEGELKNGYRHGKGTTRYVSGDTYTGEFTQNKMQGQGVYTWADGSRYVGGWVNGISHGKCMHEGANGSRYVGEYRNGEPFNGTTTRADGTQVRFANGQVVTQPVAATPTPAAPPSSGGWGEALRAIADVAKQYADIKAKAKTRGGGNADGSVCPEGQSLVNDRCRSGVAQ